MMETLRINRPPSVDRVMAYVGKLARHEHFDERMSGEDAHKAAAVFLAANHALKRDLLGNSWRGNRHMAAKCGELFERVVASDSYRQSNVQYAVDINFGSKVGA